MSHMLMANLIGSASRQETGAESKLWVTDVALQFWLYLNF
jgi:hypothetical protein